MMSNLRRKENIKNFISLEGFKNTIATKLTVLFLLLSLVPIGILIVFVRGDIEQQFLNTTTQNVYEQTKLVGVEVSLASDIDSVKTLFIQNYTKKFESFLVDINRINIVYFGEQKKFDAVYNKIPAEITHQISAKSEGVFVDANKNWAIAFYKIPEKNFTLITVTDLSETFLSLAQTERKAVIQVGAALIVAAFVSGLFIFLIMHPIKDLVKLTEKVRSGNFDVRIEPSNFEGEMQTLVIGFNQMVKDLKKAKNFLEEYSENLEKQVAVGTEELHEKIKELTKTKTAMLNMMEDLDESNKELIESEKKLKKSFRELKRLDAEKDEFISIAAHELKTPMAAIIGFSQLLIDKKIEDTETRNHYLKIIEEETKRLTKLVTDILDLSRIDLGTVKFTIEDTDVVRLAEDVKSEMHQRAKDNNLSLDLKVDGKIPQIKTDKEKIKQVIINLVDNAIKYTEGGGIRIEISTENNNVKFSVIDTGIGIPKEHFDKLFKRFYQVESHLTRKVGGSGLGLSICKECIEKLGGKIWLKSEEGKGSTFYFTLPSVFKK